MNKLTQLSFGNNPNSLATALMAEALQLNQLLFSKFYPYPLKIQIVNGQISLKFDDFFQLKYILFLVIFIFFTVILGFGSCLLVLFLNRFFTAYQPDVAAPMMCLFFLTCIFTQITTYILYFLFPEIETSGNQLFRLERKCKFFNYLPLKF